MDMPGFRTRTNILKWQHGIVSVEFAIMATLLVYLLFGILQFGWLLHNYIVIENAIGAGARFFSVQIGKTDAKANTLNVINNALPGSIQFTSGEMKTYTQTKGSTTPSECSDPNCGTALSDAPGGAASVSLVYTVQPIFRIRLWGLDQLWPTTHNFAATVSIKSTS